MGAQMMAIVAEGKGGRSYVSPSDEQARIARSAQARWKPEERVTTPSHDVDRLPMYGMFMWGDAFTQRQLVALTTFSDLVGEARERVLAHARRANLRDDEMPLNEGGTGALAYADAVAMYLAFAVDRLVESSCTLARWQSTGDKVAGALARQALAMLWDFAEVNPFSGSTRNFLDAVEWVAECFETLSSLPIPGTAKQQDATAEIQTPLHPLISTDPPYYDNIGYADLSDFFYIWLRRTMGKSYPDLFPTLLAPKVQELVATPYRFGGDRKKAETFFEEGLGEAFARMREAANPVYPLTVYYAFKQAESAEDQEDKQGSNALLKASTGWETMLEGLIKAGFRISGTWPMRTERSARTNSLEANALASSIVLVCRPRAVDAALTSRGEFLRALKRELPAALKDLQRGNIAPVDLAQAAIGPGMAVFSRYSKVLEADGSPMRVRTSLQLINQTLDEVLAEQEGEYDGETRWAVAWFEQYGMDEGPYGVAETLSKAKNTAVERLAEAGILVARGGKVRLLRRNELADEWNPARQSRLTVWEVTQRLISALRAQGNAGAAAVMDGVGHLGEMARDLAYRLYTTCGRKGWAQEALDYNTLVVEWLDLAGQAAQQTDIVQVRFGVEQ
jgi:putative DNA methylase